MIPPSGTFHAKGRALRCSFPLFHFHAMKLLIALTPGLLIGCAVVETWVSIISKKQPAPAPAAVVQARHPAPRTVILALAEKGPGRVAAAPQSLAQVKMESAKR